MRSATLQASSKRTFFVLLRIDASSLSRLVTPGLYYMRYQRFDSEAKQRIAKKADAEADYKGTRKARADARMARADAEYAVAKEKCDDLAGNPKDVCIKEAAAARTRTKADARPIAWSVMPRTRQASALQRRAATPRMTSAMPNTRSRPKNATRWQAIRKRTALKMQRPGSGGSKSSRMLWSDHARRGLEGNSIICIVTVYLKSQYSCGSPAIRCVTSTRAFSPVGSYLSIISTSCRTNHGHRLRY